MDMKLFCIFFLGVALASNIPKLDLDNFDYEEEYESQDINLDEKRFQSSTSTPTTITTTTIPSTRFAVQTNKNNTEKILDNPETKLDVKTNKTETKKDEKNNQKVMKLVKLLNNQQHDLNHFVDNLSQKQEELNDAVEEINKNIFKLMKIVSPVEKKNELAVITKKAGFGMFESMNTSTIVFIGIGAVGMMLLTSFCAFIYCCYMKSSCNKKKSVDLEKGKKKNAKSKSNPTLPVTDSLYQLTKRQEIKSEIIPIQPQATSTPKLRRPRSSTMPIGKKVESPRIPKRCESTKLTTFFENIPDLEVSLPDIHQVDFVNREKQTVV